MKSIKSAKCHVLLFISGCIYFTITTGKNQMVIFGVLICVALYEGVLFFFPLMAVDRAHPCKHMKLVSVPHG